MKLLKRMAVLSLVVLALGGCTKSSISTDAPVSGSEEIDPAKTEADDDDETLPRDQNFLVEDETVETTMYDWEQAQSECDGLFNDTTAFPQSVKMEFTYDESALNIGLTWTVKNDTTNDDAMDYAVTMVKQFNDIIAAQSMDLENSSADSFGTLWNQFSLDGGIPAWTVEGDDLAKVNDFLKKSCMEFCGSLPGDEIGEDGYSLSGEARDAATSRNGLNENRKSVAEMIQECFDSIENNGDAI